MNEKTKTSMTEGEKWLRREAVVNGLFDEHLFSLLESKDALGRELLVESHDEAVVAQMGILSKAIRECYAELGAPLPEPMDLTRTIKPLT